MIFPIVIEQDEDGYFAQCPTLPGCHTHGKTYEEVWRNIREAVELVIEDRRAHGESIPVSGMVSFATLEVVA